MRLIPIFCLLIFTLSVIACKGNPGQGGGPPSPLEAGIYANTGMSGALYMAKLDLDKLEKLEVALTTSRNIIMLALAEHPETLESDVTELIEGLDPLFVDMVSNMLQLIVLRVKPYIDTEHPDLALAKEYVEQIFLGAERAVRIAKSRQALRPGSYRPT